MMSAPIYGVCGVKLLYQELGGRHHVCGVREDPLALASLQQFFSPAARCGHLTKQPLQVVVRSPEHTFATVPACQLVQLFFMSYSELESTRVGGHSGDSRDFTKSRARPL